jgi:penicillin-binding protein 1A
MHSNGRSPLSFAARLFSWLIILSLSAGLGFMALVWYYGRDLPDVRQIEQISFATTSHIYTLDGDLVSRLASEDRILVPFKDIPPRVIHAFISAEDKNFFNHAGVDFLGIIRATGRNLRNFGLGRRMHGASTITQQLVKNSLLNNERTIARKIKEAILARQLEQIISKSKILELYLNDVFLGARSYGIGSAAHNYFDKELDELTYSEAGYLAALPKAPNNYHPVRNHERAIARRNYVLSEMHQNGYISTEQAQESMQAPLETIIARSDRNKQNTEKSIATNTKNAEIDTRYFVEEIRRQIVQDYGNDMTYTGGLTVYATLDLAMQKIANNAFRKNILAYHKRHGFTGALEHMRYQDIAHTDTALQTLSPLAEHHAIKGWNVAVVTSVSDTQVHIVVNGFSQPRGIIPLSDLKTWKIRVPKDSSSQSVGNSYSLKSVKKPSDILSSGDVIHVQKSLDTDIKSSQKNISYWSLQQKPNVNGGFIALDPYSGRILALVGGFSYTLSSFNRATQAHRQPGSAFKPVVYAAALEHGYTPASIVLDAPVTVDQGQELGQWKPRNFGDKFYGISTLRTALEKSRNLVTIRIAQDIGIETVGTYATALGLYDKMPPHLSYAIGAGETTLLQLASAYATFVNGGYYITPTFIERIQDRSGKTVYRHDTRPCKLCKPQEYNDNINNISPPPPSSPMGEKQLHAVTAYQIVSMLSGVIKNGTARNLRYLDGPVAGKTGTTNDSHDAWFIGFTPKIVAGCFIGFDSPKSLGRYETGGKVCAPVFGDFISAITDNTRSEFHKPAGIQIVPIDKRTGEILPSDSTSAYAIDEIFHVHTILNNQNVLTKIDSLLSNIENSNSDKFPDKETGDREGIRNDPANIPSIGVGTGGLY